MKRYVIAIDLGGTNIKGAVIKNFQNIINRITIPTRTYKNRRALISGISGLILRLIKEAGIEKKKILGVGVGAPGLIDYNRGIIFDITNIKGFKNVPFKKLIEERTALKTFLDNDVNVMTLGELYYGAGRGASNMVCITLGTGVGGGIVINGKIYRGSSMSAGEIGHMPLSEKGPECNCGGSGCMERFVGNKYIIRLALNKLKAGRKSLISAMAGGKAELVTPEIISAAARKGDRLAKEIWHEIGGHLGVTISGVINFLNPEKIVIGGGVAGAGRFLFGPLRETVKRRAMRVPAKCVKIVRAELGQDAGLIGAAVLVRLER